MSAPVDIMASPAVALLIELEGLGVVCTTTPEGTLRLQPGSRLSERQRRLLVAHKSEVLALMACLDEGVLARRHEFHRQIEIAAKGMLPTFVFTPGVAYLRGRCFSCSVALPSMRFARCWRCALALRLALRASIPPDFLRALEEARVA